MAERRRKTTRTVLYDDAMYRAVQERLGHNLASMREARGWTQAQAAMQCEMVLSQYQYLERGETNATLVSLVRLAHGFGVEVAELLGAAPVVKKKKAPPVS